MVEKATEPANKPEEAPAPAKLSAVKLSDLPLPALQRVCALPFNAGCSVTAKKGSAFAYRGAAARVAVVAGDGPAHELVQSVRASFALDESPLIYDLEAVVKEVGKKVAALRKKRRQ